MARKIATCDVSVLVTGETGTGKELLARAIHHLSGRNSGPLVAFSCANLPETLVEDELFGHEKGAFTGAIMNRCGRLEAADHGTLFLDEIGDLGLGLQPKLLRVLQERRFERLGGNKTINVDLRLVCATNRNLGEMVQQGKFRDDLYYRLNVVQLHLPPLRERRDDIPLLAQQFLVKAAAAISEKNRKPFAVWPYRRWKNTTGREMCANWKTWCSAAWLFRMDSLSMFAICRRALRSGAGRAGADRRRRITGPQPFL